LGAYAEIVSRPEYRDAKFTTVMTVLPDVADPSARSGLTVEADGQSPIEDPQLVQIANNPYASPDEPSPAGTRPRLDTGMLGVDVVAYTSMNELRGLVRAGVDGEAVEFPSPVEISIVPGALRVRLPKDRPGPKIGWPRLDRRIVARLWSIVVGSRDAAS
jgi:diacylglycerol kinase family enzyme